MAHLRTIAVDVTELAGAYLMTAEGEEKSPSPLLVLKYESSCYSSRHRLQDIRGTSLVVEAIYYHSFLFLA